MEPTQYTRVIARPEYTCNSSTTM